MALIQLRRKIFPNNTGTGSQYIAQVIYYDTDPAVRTLYRTQLDSALNDPAELAKDALVDTYQVRPGKALGVYYNGNGSVYTKPVPLAPGTGQNPVAVKMGLLPAYTYDSSRSDGVVDITGELGLPPYQITLTGAGGAVNRTGTSVSELYPVRFYNLPAGTYLVGITDATGLAASRVFDVGVGVGYGRAALIYEEAFSNVTNTYQWSYNDHAVVFYQYGGKSPGGFYIAPRATLLDGYLLPSGLWRRVYSAGINVNGGTDPTTLVYFEDSPTTETSELELDNLILFHPDTPAEQNGGLLLEMRASHPPLTFTLRASRAVVATNQTGHFDGLRALSYTVEVVDRLGKSLTVPVELLARYGPRWLLAYSDVAGVPCRLEMWAAGYTGAVEKIFGQASPVILKTDGLNGAIGGQGDIGPVVTTTAELNLQVTADTFEEIIGRDRYCRVDFYYDNQLHFRGFVEPSTYDAPMLPGLQNVSLTATDGLAGLKEVFMSGHLNQRLYGRRPWLNTLLHCLSRTDVALPVRLFTNRREVSMATTAAPEQEATTDRTGYWKESENEPIFQRPTLEAVAQALGGTLMQREGRWEIRNILEAAGDTEGRAYRPAGTPVGTLTVAAPTATILPPTQGLLHWLDADQVKQVRAGWKSLTGKTDVGYLKNAYPQGAVFSDKNAWLEDASRLQAVSGWRPGPGVSFPLILSRTGEKGADYTTLWPRAVPGDMLDKRYLQGPPLPLAPGGEAVPAALQLTGRFVPAEYYLDGDGNQVAAPTNAQKCVLAYELVIGGRPAGIQLAEFELAATNAAKDTVVSIPLKALPSAAPGAELRIYAWYAADTGAFTHAATLVGLQRYKKGDVVKHDFGGGDVRLYVVRFDGAFTATATNPDVLTQLTATDVGLGTFYLSSAGIQLTPQGATWEGEDNFRADGPAGHIRPSDPLEVFHPDVPLAAGLFGGNLYAFSRGVALLDGTMSTSWRRSIDKDASPLLESNVYDGLALRDGASRLLLGVLNHRGTPPPLLLDTLDAPSDVPGRRFAVCASAWDTKLAHTEVSLVQNGVGASANHPYGGITGKVLIADTLYQWLPGQFTPHALGADDGSLLSWD